MRERPIPLKDRLGSEFSYSMSESIERPLHEIDVGLGGHMAMRDSKADVLLNAESRDRYVVRSLMEEAITSSQIEGAVTTRRVAKEMLRSGRRPRDLSERMILNNYVTMRDLATFKDQPLTPGRVLEIHRMITRDTLDDPACSGRLRRAEERIRVEDEYGAVYHDPPSADELDARLEAMCSFANDDASRFVHPVVRSIILHFWLAYDHPFVDGNGRVARALFYWSMLRRDYWLCEFISISQVIRQARTQYARAFLHTETDGNDLTYFILHQIGVLQKAVAALHRYLDDEGRRMGQLRRRLRGFEFLNHRQRALVEHALSHADAHYSIESHRASHGVAYATSRSDLLDLVQRGLLVQSKPGRAIRFRPAADLAQRLAASEG